MPGIVLGEVASPTNPLLPFFYQEEGFLRDVHSLRWEIFAAGSAGLKGAGTVNTALVADGGEKVATGYYVATLDPSTTNVADGTGDSFAISGTTVTLTDSAGLFSSDYVGYSITISGSTSPGNDGTFVITACPSANTVTYTNASGVTEAFGGTWQITAALSGGAHDIVWYYVVNAGDAEQRAMYSFEVLPANSSYRFGSRYSSYVPSTVSELSEYDLADRQRALAIVSRDVERYTGRIFFPKYMELLHTVRPDSAKLWLDQPVIGVEEIIIESANVVTSTLDSFTLDNSTLVIYNRHLRHLLSPDDRDNPRIAFARVGSLTELVSFSRFHQGELNVRIKGVFGYTDPDGSPFGMVPEALMDVVTALAQKKLEDPTGEDMVLQQPGRVKKAKTRDQEIQFDTTGYSSGSSITGDTRLDDILADFCRPAHVGVAG